MLTNKLKKAKDLVRKAKLELALYQKTKNFSYSSQACEKVWVAFTLYLEQISGKELRTGSIRIIEPLAKEHELGYLCYKCFNLHVYHYEGSIAYSEDDLSYEIESTIGLMEDTLNYS